MTEQANNRGDGSSWLLGAGLGVVGTLAWTSWSRSAAKKSRAEREDPLLTEAVLARLNEVFDQVQITLDGANEAAYQRRIAGYLRKRLALRVEREPRVDGRMPDLLVEGVVAIEVKVRPMKSEVDRAVGQCMDYATLWPTLLVIVDSRPSLSAAIERRFLREGCDRVHVVAFERLP